VDLLGNMPDIKREIVRGYEIDAWIQFWRSLTRFFVERDLNLSVSAMGYLIMLSLGIPAGNCCGWPGR